MIRSIHRLHMSGWPLTTTTTVTTATTFTYSNDNNPNMRNGSFHN